MLVRTGEQTLLAAPAKAEAAPDVVWRDYYTRLSQIRLTAEAPSPAEITLDGNDVGTIVECAIRHPSPDMRSAVLAAIWSHPDSFGQLFRFGLDAAPGFPEIRRIVAEELEKRLPKPADSNTLLPRMPRPAHLPANPKDRERP
jgi:hypothetical protein